MTTIITISQHRLNVERTDRRRSMLARRIADLILIGEEPNPMLIGRYRRACDKHGVALMDLRNAENRLDRAFAAFDEARIGEEQR